MKNSKIVPKHVIDIFGISINNAMVSAMLVTVLTIIAVVVVRIFFIPKWRKNLEKTNSLQVFCESLVSAFDNTGHDLLGKESKNIVPIYFVFAFFIFFGTMTEMLGLRPPTSDFSFTITCGVVSFLIITFYGFKRNKLKRFKRYIPNVIYLISDLVVPISLSLRLFCAVSSGTIIMEMIYSRLPVYFLVGFPIIASLMFTVFHAVIQSYIFMLLSESFVQEAME